MKARHVCRSGSELRQHIHFLVLSQVALHAARIITPSQLAQEWGFMPLQVRAPSRPGRDVAGLRCTLASSQKRAVLFCEVQTGAALPTTMARADLDA